MPLRDRPLRIWQICESYPPHYGGGAAIIVRDISHALAGRGHDVQVLTTESRPGADYTGRIEPDESVRVERINLRYFRERDPDGWQLGMRAWRRHERRIAQLIEERIRSWRPDIVQYHTTRPFGEGAPLAIARNGLPIVAMLHEAWFLCARLMLLRSPQSEPCSGPGPVKCLECMYSHYDGGHRQALPKLTWRLPRLGIYPAYRLWRRRAARRALTGAVGYSHFMVDAHQTRTGGEARYVPIGINLAGVPATRPSRPRKPLRFGFFGGFQPNKGIWSVLDAAAALKRQGLEFELHIWGPQDGDETAEVAARDLEDRVLLRGVYAPREMWETYREIDVAVMATTVCEPFGRVPLEARAVGAPTIAPAIGGLGESIRDDVDGLLFEFGDVKELERQMRRVLTEKGLFERLVAGLLPTIDTRTRGEVLEATYRSILAEHPTLARS